MRTSRNKKDTAVRRTNSRGPALPRHQGSRLRTRKLRSTPMTCCRPRTEHKAIRATQGRATSRATSWTRHRAVCTIRGKEGTSSKGGEEKKKGYLRDYPLAGGYQFQGWHFGGERNRARFTGTSEEKGIG